MLAKFNQSIINCINLANDYGFLAQAGSNTSLKLSAKFIATSRDATSYRELYDVGVETQNFNIMIFDHSFFQFTIKPEQDGYAIRLAYYPNPYFFIEYMNEKRDALSLFKEDEITLEEYEQLISESSNYSETPIIRYDLSREQYCTNYHPTAHFHIGFNSESRWPVKIILSPLAFFLNIVKNYYMDIWLKAEINNEPFENILESKYKIELESCPLIEQEYFNHNDEKRLYFT